MDVKQTIFVARARKYEISREKLLDAGIRDIKLELAKEIYTMLQGWDMYIEVSSKYKKSGSVYILYLNYIFTFNIFDNI
ncbi:hypothetical protein [Clostridium sp. BL-8]|uniref:hypothetical protein n=1 Tax=Clostridium sp. BL-8 TaxID=349938 RepID=UPI00098C3C66|nr:hypothetical protein [Clostridium sp. BL-8]OOM80468.1 hypothetical protein CLOBL_09480 [Clostridium sp. BL-8]